MKLEKVEVKIPPVEYVLTLNGREIQRLANILHTTEDHSDSNNLCRQLDDEFGIMGVGTRTRNPLPKVTS